MYQLGVMWSNVEQWGVMDRLEYVAEESVKSQYCDAVRVLSKATRVQSWIRVNIS